MSDCLIQPFEQTAHLAAIGVEVRIVGLCGNRPGDQTDRQRGLTGAMRQNTHQVQCFQVLRKSVQDLSEDGLGLS